MKKFFIFAAFIAAVTMFSSCKKDAGTKPKARFDYEIDGLKVTFTNMSKDATSYTWEFGDGTLFSEQENPVHEYAAAGTYHVKLTAKNAAGEAVAEDDIVLAEKSIEIDGDFSDWDAISKDKLAVAVMTEDSKWENLYKMMWCTDADYMYFYVEFSAETYEGLDDDGNPVMKNMVDPIDIYMDIDGDPTTGSNSYLWENSAADVLIEGFWNDNFESAGVYVFPADAEQDAWAWVDAEVVGSTTTCDRQILGNGHAAIEGKIMMALLPIQVEGLNVGVFTSTSDWSESGVLPETKIDGDGVSIPSPLLAVKLAE